MTASLRKLLRGGEPRDLRHVRADARAILDPINALGLLSIDDVVDAITNPEALTGRRGDFPLLRPTTCDGIEPSEHWIRSYVARQHAAHVWAGLAPLNAAGVRYLASRGIDCTRSRIRDELRCTPLRLDPTVRERWPELERVCDYYNRLSGVAIAARSPVDGRAVDVRLRRFAPGADDPRVIGIVGGFVRDREELHGCYGAPHRLSRERVIVVEGVVDYVTALQLWPDADVLGATDAGAFPLVAELAARHVHSVGGQLLLVVHADRRERDIGAGERNGIKAGRRAIDAGLELDSDLIFVNLKGAADLNAAHASGWRP